MVLLFPLLRLMDLRLVDQGGCVEFLCDTRNLGGKSSGRVGWEARRREGGHDAANGVQMLVDECNGVLILILSGWGVLMRRGLHGLLQLSLFLTRVISKRMRFRGRAVVSFGAWRGSRQAQGCFTQRFQYLCEEGCVTFYSCEFRRSVVVHTEHCCVGVC